MKMSQDIRWKILALATCVQPSDSGAREFIISVFVNLFTDIYLTFQLSTVERFERVECKVKIPPPPNVRMLSSLGKSV